MKHTEIRDMNKTWRKFRLQTNEEKVQESKIKSIINLVNEQNLKNLSEEELNNFYAEVKKITKLFTGEGKVADLKGGDFYDRFLYSAFGVFPENNQVDIFGELDLSIENLTKNAEQFEIYWKKDGQVSQEINLKSFYPHFLGSDLGFLIQYYFENYNALFTKSERRIMLNTFLPILHKVTHGFIPLHPTVLV